MPPSSSDGGDTGKAADLHGTRPPGPATIPQLPAPGGPPAPHGAVALQRQAAGPATRHRDHHCQPAHRHERREAKILLARLWESGNGTLSVQVLQELFVSLTRRVANRLSAEEARAIVRDLSTWNVVEPTRHDVLEAIDNSTRWNLSFWHAMLLTAAQRSGASTVWSEDLKDGEMYDGMMVRNPFR